MEGVVIFLPFHHFLLPWVGSHSSLPVRHQLDQAPTTHTDLTQVSTGPRAGSVVRGRSGTQGYECSG